MLSLELRVYLLLSFYNYLHDFKVLLYGRQEGISDCKHFRYQDSDAEVTIKTLLGALKTVLVDDQVVFQPLVHVLCKYTFMLSEFIW